MKILMVNNIFPPGFLGGYELGMFDVARGLTKRGHEVRVLTSDYFLDEKREISELEVIRTLECVAFNRGRVSPSVVRSRGPYLIGRNLRAVHSAMRESPPDAVMLCNLAGLGALGLVQFVVGVGYRPVLYLMDDVFFTVRDNREGFRRWVASCGLSEYLAKVRPIAMSRVLRDEVRATVGGALPEPVIVPGWHGTVAGTNGAPERREHDGCRFVFSSQLADHKGIWIALRAVSLAVERGAKGLSLDLYGAGDPKAVLARAAEMGLRDIVRYRGSFTKEEMCRRFAEYDAFLMPTWEREPFGFVVSEAAANSCLPIITAQIGAAEWFLDGVDCYKVSRDAAAFAGAILEFLALSPGERNGLRARARKTALTHLGFDDWIRVIEDVTAASSRDGEPWDPERAARSSAAMLVLEDTWETMADAIF